MRQRTFLMAGIVGMMFLAAGAAFGQGIIVPPEQVPIRGTFAVQSVHIDATIRDQVAQVQLSQTFRNTGDREMQVVYLFPVPHDGAISNLTLMVDEQEFEAKVYPREEARRIYESYVRQNVDPALVEYMGYGAIQTSVFPVPAGQTRTVTLRYAQVIRQDDDVREFAYPLSTGKLSATPIEQLRINITLESATPLRTIYSPTYPVEVRQGDERSATITLARDNFTPADDLRLLWSLSERPVGATLLSYNPAVDEDGYFLLLASPQVVTPDAETASKTVVFVLDRSGSMSGRKIEQARNALLFVLDNLNEGDTFNIIVYDGQVESFRPELERFTAEMRAEAARYVQGIRAGGGTNIDGALQRALGMVADVGQPAYVLFLTDGQPTVGETSEMKIAENAGRANTGRARLFSFGVGYDVNARLLDRLSSENHGVTEYVRPNEDIEASVARFFGKITAPVLADVSITMEGAEVNRSYPRNLPDLFAGGQILWVGRYQTGGDVKITLSGKVGDQEQQFEYEAKLAGDTLDETYAFVEKLWAARRIGQIIDDLDLHGQNQELIEELVQLSTKHGILTPYTAFLADENVDLQDRMGNSVRAREEAGRELAQVGGEAGVNLRAAKAEQQYAANAPGAGRQMYRAADGKMQEVAAAQVVGNNALFLRNGQWMDPAVSDEEAEKAEIVEQFSDRYFELARDNAQLRRFLALPEGCTVKVDGNVYQITQRRG